MIIGGGFAGVNAAVGAVERLGSAQSKVSVELINPSPYWVIKPRLYESDLAGVRVPLTDVLEPLGVIHHQTSVTAIDTTEHAVATDDGSTLTYDHLIVAAGSRLALPEGPVYCADSYEDAVELRQVVDKLKRAKRRFRAVVVGGSFTGIELATELARDADVTLIAAPRLAPGYGPRGLKSIEEALASLNVTVLPGSRAQKVFDGGVLLSDGTQVTTDLVTWATGPRASALTEQISAKRDEFGRLVVDEHLQTGVTGVWAAGDSARAKVDGVNYAVMSCQHAGPQGRRAGENAAAVTLGQRPRRYRQPAYLTCLALGSYGGLLTCGFDRDRVLATRQEAGAMKHTINHGLIYPPEGEGREAMVKIGKPAPSGPIGAALMQQALRSRWVRGKMAGAVPERAGAYTAVESGAPRVLKSRAALVSDAATGASDCP